MIKKNVKYIVVAFAMILLLMKTHIVLATGVLNENTTLTISAEYR